MPLTPEEARRTYDRLGSTLDRTERFEARAKSRGVQLLELAPGERVVELGVGTGRVAERLLALVGAEGRVIGLDLSKVMLGLARRRAEAAGLTGPLELHERDAAKTGLPGGAADALYTSYLLDLLPESAIRDVVREAHRVLRPGGRAVFVGMTPPRGLLARILIAIWSAVSAIAPRATGGCRPLLLEPFLREAGFVATRREAIEQAGFPSEVVLARKGG